MCEIVGKCCVLNRNWLEPFFLHSSWGYWVLGIVEATDSKLGEGKIVKEQKDKCWKERNSGKVFLVASFLFYQLSFFLFDIIMWILQVEFIIFYVYGRWSSFQVEEFSTYPNGKMVWRRSEKAACCSFVGKFYIQIRCVLQIIRSSITIYVLVFWGFNYQLIYE